MQCCASKKSFFRIRIYIIFRIRNTSKVEDERQITSFAAVKILNFFTYRYLSVIGLYAFSIILIRIRIQIRIQQKRSNLFRFGSAIHFRSHSIPIHIELKYSTEYGIILNSIRIHIP
jgi:hypothetical protein